MKDRIRQLMISQHLNQQSFADALEISAASLSSIFNDRTKPTLNHIDAIKKKFPNINLDWLLYGEGSMFLNDDSSQPDQAGLVKPEQTTLNFGDTVAPVQQPHPLQHSFDGNTQPEVAAFHDQMTMKIINKNARKITEIRVFYDDQTWETFVPKN